MKRFLTALLLAVSGLFGSIQAYSSTQAVEQCKQLSIIITDQFSPAKNEVIDELLALQKSLIIPIKKPIPEENVKNGFLLIPMTPQYVNSLLEQKNGMIVGAYQDGTLLGYILLIDISEFKELYQDIANGSIETDIDYATLEALFSQPSVGYIEQIGVMSGYSKMGIGTTLINASKNLKPNGLVADVFLTPLTNEASLQFFSKMGFEKSGILYQYPRVNFPYSHTTQALFWNLKTT